MCCAFELCLISNLNVSMMTAKHVSVPSLRTPEALLPFCLFPAIPSRVSPKHPASTDASSTYKSCHARDDAICMYTHAFYVDGAATGSHKLTCKSRVPHTRLFLPWRTLRWKKKTLESDEYMADRLTKGDDDYDGKIGQGIFFFNKIHPYIWKIKLWKASRSEHLCFIKMFFIQFSWWFW